jgi:hypothetical protein
VTLHVERGPALERRQFSASFLRRLEAALPDDGRAELRRDDTFRIAETWLWHPIGNEELVVGGGCTAGTTSRECGRPSRVSRAKIRAAQLCTLGELPDPLRAECRPLGLSWIVVDDADCGTVLRLADPATNTLLPTPAEKAEAATERVRALEEELRRLKASTAR